MIDHNYKEEWKFEIDLRIKAECRIETLEEQVKEYDKALLDIIRGDKAHVDQVFAVLTRIKAMGDKPMNTLSPARDPAYAMDEDSND